MTGPQVGRFVGLIDGLNDVSRAFDGVELGKISVPTGLTIILNIIDASDLIET